MLCQEYPAHPNYTSSAHEHPIYSLAVQLKTTDRACGATGTKQIHTECSEQQMQLTKHSKSQEQILVEGLAELHTYVPGSVLHWI